MPLPVSVKMAQLAVIFTCLPSFLLAAPAEENLKQQIAAAGYLRNEEPQWNYMNPDNAGIEVQLRSLDSLGRGHILRSLGEGDSSWLGGGNSGGNFGWRFNGLKRGSGLDSLGRGNILRSIPDDVLQRYFKSLDSLGRGNILKRSTPAVSAVVARSNGRSSAKQHPSFDPLAGEGFGFQKKFDSLSGITFGNQKRNFDEIDNAGFGAFVKKNFDEIDNVGMGFRKRNFDEIDNAGFGAFLKRNM